MEKPWIGVDLDGTLAEIYGWYGVEHVGKPIPKMVERVKKWIAEGRTVKIFTARASGDDKDIAIPVVQKWCVENLGTSLEVVCQKDYSMVELWDDRAITVEHNMGNVMTRQQ